MVYTLFLKVLRHNKSTITLYNPQAIANDPPNTVITERNIPITSHIIDNLILYLLRYLLFLYLF